MKQIIIFLLLVGLSIGLQAYTITSYRPQDCFTGTSTAQVDALNAAVGITGWTVENFEDATFIPTLSFSYSGFSTTANGLWDGAQFAYSSVSTSMNFSTGITGFAVGLGDIESDMTLYINGVNHGLVRSLPNYNRTIDDAREVFIKIMINNGDALITQIGFQGVNSGDWIYFDHLAITTVPIPEPATLLLALFGLFLARKIKK